jgi:hypothetical protein
MFFVILDYRGKGLDRRAGFRSDQAATAYHVLLRRHRARVAESGPLLAESARLPAALCWALDLLTAQCRAAEDPVANELWALCAASTAAAQLHRAAADRLLGSRADALLERRMHIVRKLVDRLGEIGPAKRRELLRGLAQQSLAVNGPLIDALIRTGVFHEGEDKVLSLGEVPLADFDPAELTGAEFDGAEAHFPNPCSPPNPNLRQTQLPDLQPR